MPADPKKHKKLLELPVFFVLLGSAHVKAARKMLVKLAPENVRRHLRVEQVHCGRKGR